MRFGKLALLSLSAMVLLAPMAGAQTYQAPSQGGLGTAAGVLNNLVNPQQQNQQNQGYQQQNQGYNQRVNDNRSGPYAQYSDDQLRTESRRTHDEARTMDDEMRRRNLR